MILSNKFKGLALVLAIGAASSTASAQTSSASEYRGYSNCLSAVASDSLGLAAKRTYLLDKSGDTNAYYINASRWENGAREPVRIACQTSRNGRILLSHATEEGRFSRRRGAVSIEIADR